MRLKIFWMLALFFLLSHLGGQTRAAESTKTSFAQMKQQLQVLANHSSGRATISLKDGRQIQGQVKEVRTEEFVMRNGQKRETTVVAFRDVEKIEQKETRSLEKGVAISFAATLGALLALLLGRRLRFES